MAWLEEYIWTPKGTVKDQEAHLNCPQPNLVQPPHHQEQSPMGMNKQWNAQGSTKSRQRSHCVKSMDSDTDHIVASLDVEGITNNYNTWNHLAMHK